MEVEDIPAMGYKALKIELTSDSAPIMQTQETEVLENKYYKLVIDKNTGSISSLFDNCLLYTSSVSVWLEYYIKQTVLHHTR